MKLFLSLSLSIFTLSNTSSQEELFICFPNWSYSTYCIAIKMFHSLVLSCSNTLYLHWCYFWCVGKTARTFSSISVLPQARTSNAQAHVWRGSPQGSRCASLWSTAHVDPARDKRDAPLLCIPMWNYTEHNSIPSGLPLWAQGPFDTR